MSSTDYLRAAETSEMPVGTSGPVPATPWDPRLQPEMATRAAAIYEEALREDLLAAMNDVG